MATVETNTNRLEGVPSVDALGKDWEAPESEHKIIADITGPDEHGLYSAVALNLPGAQSQGASRNEAIESLKSAINGLIVAYRENNMSIPWDTAIDENVNGFVTFTVNV